MHFFISTHLQVNYSILNVWLISPWLWLMRLNCLNRLTALISIQLLLSKLQCVCGRVCFWVVFKHTHFFYNVTHLSAFTRAKKMFICTQNGLKRRREESCVQLYVTQAFILPSSATTATYTLTSPHLIWDVNTSEATLPLKGWASVH